MSKFCKSLHKVNTVASTKKPTYVFDDAYEPFPWMKINAYEHMIGVNVPEQNRAKADPYAGTAAENFRKISA